MQTMNPQLPFEKGVRALLKVKWTLKTKSPLVIRQGVFAEFKSDKNRADKDTKGRKLDPVFKWTPTGSENQVADFAYQFFLAKNEAAPDETPEIRARYHIPASSIRGALRAAAIERWVEWQQRDLFMLRKKENESSEDETDAIQASVKRTCDAMKRGETKWMHILSLFGIAFNPNNDPENPFTWAGRLQLETEPLETADGKSIKYAGKSFTAKDGPENMQRTIGMRTPVDRITGGAKESAGGIHHWVEMPKGQTFVTQLTIANPCQTDIDLLADWRMRVKAGFLTFGGLASVGRGEVNFFDDKNSDVRIPGETYELFKPGAEAATFTADPLDMFWQRETFTDFKSLQARQNKLPSHSAPEVAPQTPEGENHVPQS